VIRRAVFLLFAVFFTASASASEQKLALDELTRAADLIVKARVVDITTLSRDGGNLTTLVTLAVEETWKGSPPEPQLTISIRGGAAGGIAQAVSGEPRFSSGERTLVFLKAAGTKFTVVGRRQGKFVVTTDAEGKDTVKDITGTTWSVDILRSELKNVGSH
jgi:hypothetical protein